MNLKQAHYVRTISECGSLTAAAKKLYVSQPSLSQMLRQIESEIGLTIFDRSVSPFRLTYAGEKYLEAADAMLKAAEQLEQQLLEIRNEHSGRLRLGISVTRAMQVLPRVLPIFTEKYPNVAFELTECGSATLEKLLETGQIDLALAAIESSSTNMAFELIEKETVGILAGRDSNLARQHRDGARVTLADAAQDRFVILTPTHSVRLIQDKLFRRSNFSPPVLLETNSLEVGRRVTLEAGACMLLPNIYADEYVTQRRGEFFPLRDFDNNRHFYACYRKNEFLPSYTRDFIRIVTQVLSQARGPFPGK
ncbi:MAG: LysR family transcriptional regulator [Eubacteriales bacterium]|nr:LysR family transcriptional regulator [Eubacteriales bacterium]